MIVGSTRLADKFDFLVSNIVVVSSRMPSVCVLELTKTIFTTRFQLSNSGNQIEGEKIKSLVSEALLLFHTQPPKCSCCCEFILLITKVWNKDVGEKISCRGQHCPNHLCPDPDGQRGKTYRRRLFYR